VKYLNLPNYFLADLPPEAPLNAIMIEQACQTLKRNRAQYLANRSTTSLIKAISEVAANWLEADYPFRQEALTAGPGISGFSAAILARGLDAFFRQLTPENLHGLLQQELGHGQRLDKMVSAEVEHKNQIAALALGPELIAHITAGNIPSPTLLSLVLGLLTRSAQFFKCASGTVFLPRLFAHSLYEAEPKLGACLELAEWPGGSLDLESALFAEADCITATGSDETLDELCRRLPRHKRFLGYGHRVSFAYVAREELAGFNGQKLVARAADDVVAWDQLGCLSPHVIYVERNGRITPEQFAELLAQELERREAVEPRGQINLETAAAIASRRSFYEVRGAYSPDTRHWASKDSTAWTVVFEADPRFQLSCLHRFIYVKSVTDLTEALQSADAVRGKVSTAGLAASGDKAADLAAQLARWGVTRICPLGRMQNPPLIWRHDGRPPLADLVTWANWEQ
jgi:hypothetical protein